MVYVRSIREAAEWFRGQDPETRITETMIRGLVTSNKIPSCKVGREYVIAVEAVENYLSGNMGFDGAQSDMELEPVHGEKKTRKGNWRVE